MSKTELNTSCSSANTSIPVSPIFLLQYIPASLLLARCYERCNSIWGSIFFHMLINAVSFSALSVLG